MGKVILFSRVSTLGQDLTQQNNELFAEAKRNGFAEKDIILIEQKESAIKLDEEERKGIAKLKETIMSQKIDCVIIYEISRLARRPTVLYSVRDFLIENNVHITISLDGPTAEFNKYPLKIGRICDIIFWDRFTAARKRGDLF